MSKILKRSIKWVTAIVCSITLFLAGAFIVPKPITAAGTQPNSSYEIISFSNFEIADGVYDSSNASTANPVTATMADSFDKKYFSAEVKFTDAAMLFLADDGSGNGLTINSTNSNVLNIRFNGSNQYVILGKLPANTLTSFLDTKFNLGVQFELYAADSDGTKNDLKLGVWINGVLYNNDFFIYKNNATNFSNNKILTISCASNTAIEIKSDPRAKVLPNKSLEWISLEHFYIADGTYGTNSGKASVGGVRPVNLYGTYFTTNIKFSATEGATFRYAGDVSAPGLSGMSFTLKNGKLNLTDAVGKLAYEYNYEAAKAGLTSFADTTFKLGISMEYVDADEDTLADDLKLGIWFNDVLYENEFKYINDCPEKTFGRAAGVFSSVAGSTVTLGVVDTLRVTMPNRNLETYTLENIGIPDGEYGYQAGGAGLGVVGAYQKSIIDKYFSVRVKYNVDISGFNAIHFGSIDGWQYTRIIVDSKTTMKITNTSQVEPLATIDAATAGLKSFSDNWFRLGVSVEALDNDGDGQKDDIKMGVYFNEDLYNDTFIYLNDYVGVFGSTFATWSTTPNSKIHLQNIPEFVPVPILSAPNEELKLLTFGDYGISNGSYSFNSYAFSFMGATLKPLDNTYTVVNTKITNPENKQIYFRIGGEGWGGINITVGSDRMTVNDVSGYSTASYTLFAKFTDLDEPTFYGQKFKLGFSIEILDTDGDGQRDDVRLGVYINDKLCSGQYCDFADYAQYLTKALNLYVESDKATVEIESMKIPVNFKEFGFTEDWARELSIYGGSSKPATNTGSTGTTQSPQTGEKANMVKAILVSCIGLCGLLRDENKKLSRVK